MRNSSGTGRHSSPDSDDTGGAPGPFGWLPSGGGSTDGMPTAAVPGQDPRLPGGLPKGSSMGRTLAARRGDPPVGRGTAASASALEDVDPESETTVLPLDEPDDDPPHEVARPGSSAVREQPLVARRRREEDDDHPGDQTGGHEFGDLDETGGLEVLGAGAEEPRRGRRGAGGGRGGDGGGHDGGRGGGRGGGGRDGGGRRARRPLAVLLSLLVLAGMVAGVYFGGRALLEQINPTAADYTGSGTGEVQVKINPGDNLRVIGRTLASADVIASVSPFTDAASANPAATGIQPGVYGMRQQMSGQAALELLLDPSSKLSFGVVVPEGLTVQQTLTVLSDSTQIPLEQFTAAATDPVALGLPPYAGGLLEGFLFPATYTFDLDETPAGMLTDMVSRAVQVLDDLQVPVDQRLTIVTTASLAQAEAGPTTDMAKVTRVIDNRLAAGMPLQFDTTVNYATGKAGLTTTAEDRANPSPYNTYVHPGLPPGAIDSPGEDALKAALAPADGNWLFFVVVDPDTGDTRFADTAQEHAANVALFQQWLAEHPGG